MMHMYYCNRPPSVIVWGKAPAVRALSWSGTGAGVVEYKQTTLQA